MRSALAESVSGLDQGDGIEQCRLGMMYYVGSTDVQQDYAQAAALSQEAADHGNADAQYNLEGIHHWRISNFLCK